MKILIVCPSYPPLIDGLSGHTYCLAKALAKKDQEIHILTSELAHLPHYEFQENIHIHRQVKSWALLNALDIIESIKEINFDQILIQYVPFLYSKRGGLSLAILYLTWAIRWFFGKKAFLYAHELFYPLQKNYKAIIMHFGHRMMLFSLGLCSNKIFTSTHKNRLILTRMFYWRKKDILHLPVSSNIPKTLVENKEHVLANLGLKSNLFTICCFGFLHPSKLYPEILDTLKEIYEKKLLDFQLIFIGPTEKDLMATLGFQYSCKRLPFLKLTGPIEERKVSQLLQCCNLFIGLFMDGLTSRRGSVLAAMEHGLPIISTKSIDTEEWLFSHPEISFLPSQSTQIKRDLLQEILKQKNQKNSSGLSEYYYQHFSWEQTAAILLSTLHR